MRHESLDNTVEVDLVPSTDPQGGHTPFYHLDADQIVDICREDLGHHVLAEVVDTRGGVVVGDMGRVADHNPREEASKDDEAHMDHVLACPLRRCSFCALDSGEARDQGSQDRLWEPALVIMNVSVVALVGSSWHVGVEVVAVGCHWGSPRGVAGVVGVRLSSTSDRDCWLGRATISAHALEPSVSRHAEEAAAAAQIRDCWGVVGGALTLLEGTS